MNPEHDLPFNHLADASFSLALFELANGPIHYNYDRLDSLLFNPIENRQNDINYDLDPDNHLDFDATRCTYFIEDQINVATKDRLKPPSFSVIHLNARSLVNNFDKFKQLFDNIDHSFSAIGVTETWLNDHNSDQVNIPGYNFISNNRSTKIGGGTGIYLQSHFEFKSRNECNFSNPDVIESLFIEICIPNGKNIIAGTIYRPPNKNIEEFLEVLNQITSTITKENKHCYIMGDFNIDLLQHDKHPTTNQFLDNMFSFMLCPIITRPTRLTSHSATLIDNIFTNNISRNSFTGLLVNDLSDHLPIFTLVYDEIVPTLKKNVKTFVRDFNDKNIEEFKSRLKEQNWSDISNFEEPNQAYNVFLDKYTKLYDSCFPLKTMKGKSLKTLLNPWMTKGILNSVRKKNYLYKKQLKNPDPVLVMNYKLYKNKLNHLIRTAKRKYYTSKLEAEKQNLKATWKIINEIINKRKPRVPLPSKFKLNNKDISNPAEIADHFCEYFTNVGPSLVKAMPNANVDFHTFLTANNYEPIDIQPITLKELESTCKSFKTGKSPGYDNISMSIIKSTFHTISAPLLHIINLSITSGIFPDKLKIAKIIPIYKSDNPEHFQNYRPISVLPSFSKFFEKVIHNRLLEYLNQQNILYDHQYGFRKGRSTSLPLIHLLNKISTAIDQNEITAGVFLDLSKAFDTLDHEIFFSKLEYYGIRDKALQLIKSYFSNRKQFVQFNDIKSSSQTIKCGVPQGSILGPLFFILYINDLPNASPLTQPLLFADDTSLFLSDNDIHKLISTLNTELSKVSDWMKANKLTVNTKKTTYILFRPRQKIIHLNIPLFFDNRQLTLEHNVKFLGVFINENLSWKQHINHISIKISKSIGIIYRSRYFLSQKSKLSLYYTLIYPYLIYCNVVWSSTYVSNLHRLFLLQKRIIRILTNADYRAHSAPLFAKLKILNIFSIASFHIAKFMFSYHNSLLPSSFQNLFTTNCEIHNYNTRNVLHYRPYLCRTNIKQHTILFQGPKIWNSLPSNISSLTSKSLFSISLRQYLISKQ